MMAVAFAYFSWQFGALNRAICFFFTGKCSRVQKMYYLCTVFEH